MKRNALVAIFLVVILSLSIPLATAEVSCTPPTALSAVVSDENVRYLVFGEVHGTVEAPAVFAESVCAMVASGRKVLVGLEVPEDSRSAFQEFLLSAGNPEDIRTLLSESGWSQQATHFPDGRTSHAMLSLVKRLRELRAGGYELSVIPFQRSTPGPHESQTPYERGLAASLMEADANGTYDLVMVLVGNLHASKAVVRYGSSFEPMAMHLPQDETVSLRMVSEGGTAWICIPQCGVHPLGASVLGEIVGIIARADIVHGYDGVFNVGRTSASMPAIEAP